MRRAVMAGVWCVMSGVSVRVSMYVGSCRQTCCRSCLACRCRVCAIASRYKGDSVGLSTTLVNTRTAARRPILKGHTVSVLETIGMDYHSIPQSEASTMLAKVTKAIANAISTGLRTKRTIGDLLNKVAASGLATAAAAEGNDRSWASDDRETALSNYIQSVGILKDEASAWRHYANGETARELAGMPKPLAVSGYRYIETDTSVEAIADMLKAEFVNIADGETAPKPTRDNVGKAAHTAGIGTDAAANIGKKRNETTDTDTVAPTSDAALVAALVSDLRSLVDGGYVLPLTVVKHIEATLKASDTARHAVLAAA